VSWAWAMRPTGWHHYVCTMTRGVWLAFSVLCVVWGIPYFFIKLALTEIAPVGIAWSRIAIAASILLPIAWKRGALRSIGEHKAALAAFTFAELVVPFVLIAFGETWISSSLTGILLATMPLTVILVAPLFGIPERLGWRRMTGLAVGFIGVVVLLGIDSIGGLSAWAGVGCILVATVGYAVGAMIVQRHLGEADELGAVAVCLSAAALVLLPAAVWTAPSHLPSILALASTVVLGVVCTALGLFLYLFVIARAGAARAAVITYINPAVATLLGVGVLREPFGAASALGLALILSGSWLATGRGR
jgi:drug/metabolite transporter (DMT)-like permease